MRRFLSLALLVPLVTLPIGCQLLFSPDDNGQGLALELDLDPEPLAMGETATVTLTVRNHGGDNFRLNRNDSSCLITFLLVDHTSETAHRCAPDIQFIILSERASWSQTYRWLPRAASDSSTPLPPGEYTLVGRLESVEMTLTSDPVTFRIVQR